ncbi:MAG: 5'/3'-nucleotidase SurE [Acidimicrobiales bacterium]|nr:5'/3'-nucleotidase SurE [Acidimicrobiales bacterium]HRW37748.1 5'/3'-nucleotidase SurE [Aquihabitans sp.]
MSLHPPRRATARLATVALAGALALLCSSCLYFPAFRQLQKGSPGAVPWWCAANESGAALTPAECDAFSIQIDVIAESAAATPTVADAEAAGATYLGSVDGAGALYQRAGADTSTFDVDGPQVLLYTGTGDDDRLAGVAHHLVGPDEPAGYPGDRDHWIGLPGLPTNEGASTASLGITDWFLPMWIVRGYEEQTDVFADTHPCLEPGVTLGATTDACFVASHPEPLEVVVTNDDGIAAPGIDAVVNELLTVPGLDVEVVAPATNQSGKGDTQTPGGATGQAAQTASGVAAHAVNGTPADSVIYALNQLQLTPGLVVSGTNYGANMGPVIPLSGTVGAARTAARLGFPAVAVSTGFGPTLETTDFQTSAEAAAQWVEEFRLGLVGPPGTEVANINVPSCAAGSSVRGTLDTAVATALNGRNYNGQDCTSTVTTIADDIDAMNHGYISRTDAKRS